MKLKKADLLKKTRKQLQELGYIEVKDTLTGAEGLFIKKAGNDLFLSLGLTISRQYDNLFTASFYLSKTTLWSSMWGDIPRHSYVRVSGFLTLEEREQYLDKQINGGSTFDGWWRGDNQSEIENFIKTVQISEQRFLAQKELLASIESSKEVEELVSHTREMFRELNQGDNKVFKYEFLPTNKIDDIPIEWFMAAERTLKKMNGVLNSNAIKLLAADAWRQNKVLKIILNN